MNEAECDVRAEDIRQFLDEYEGGPETAAQILTILEEEVSDRVTRIRATFEAGDLETATEVTHKLTSSVGVLGNACQTETIRELEKELRAVQPNGADRSDSQLRRKIDRTEKEMRALLSAIEQVLPTIRGSRD